MSDIVSKVQETELRPASVPEVDIEEDVLFRCLAWIGAFHGDERSVAAWSHGVSLGGVAADAQALLKAASHAGYSAALVKRSLGDLPPYVLPVIVLLEPGQALVLVRCHEDGSADVAIPEGVNGLLSVTMALDDIADRASGYCILVKPPHRPDARAGTPQLPASAHWFWGTLWRFRSHYWNTVLASVMINVLSLASIFFTMNVYDRVVPTQAYHTLWTLAVGTALAMSFEFIARQLRSYLVDIAGKKTDLLLGSTLFRQAMDIRLESRSSSSGAFANRLREYESVREFMTSATISALSDLPFALMYLVVIVAIGGALAWVPFGAVVLVLLAGLAVQWPLAHHMQENHREASLRHGLLIETLEGIETLKSLNGQPRMQRNWEDYSAVTAASSMKARLLTSLTLNFVSYVQQLLTVVLVVWGVYLIHAGNMSMGALIAVVMLGRQAVSPLGQAVGLAVRFQQAKVALTSLNALMVDPTDRVAGQSYLSRTSFGGALRTEDLGFCYADQKIPALVGVNIRVEAGERVAILGRIGCGKSTLLRTLSALYLPSQGAVYADDIDLRQLDPADIHRNIGLVAQDCKLFYGSLRDNLTIGVPHVSLDRVLQVCRVTGLDAVVRRHPSGLDMMLGENGAGLSGGQRQLVALTRCLLASPCVLLMDEPTSSMDAQTERAFIDRLKAMPGNRTMVIATHRLSLLELVDRVIVLEQGRVVADGPKHAVMQALTQGEGMTVKVKGAKGAAA